MAIEKRLIKFLLEASQFRVLLNFTIEVIGIFNEVLHFRKILSTNLYVGFLLFVGITIVFTGGSEKKEIMALS